MIEKNIINKTEQGNRLKELRVYLRLTQKEFGNKIGLKWSQIKDREAGIVKISPSEAKIISYIYNISCDWLLTGQGNMKNEQYETSATLSSPVFDTDTAYQPKINTADLVHKMKAVLRSNTAYSTALKDIIVAYYEATICQEELAEQQKESS